MATSTLPAFGLPDSIEQSWQDTNEQPPQGEDEAAPFFVMAGLMADKPGERPLPSHGGASLPGQRFDAPISGHGRSGLFVGQQHRFGSGAVTMAGPAPIAMGGRPQSAPATKAPQPPPPPPPPPTASHSRRPTTAKASSRPTGPSPQTLYHVLQRELAHGRQGVPSGHINAVSLERLPIQQRADVQRSRNKTKLRDVTMIPTSLRAWESQIERQQFELKGQKLPSGYGRAFRRTPINAATSAPAAAARELAQQSLAPRAADISLLQASGFQPRYATGGGATNKQEPPPHPPRLTPYEMRRFLQHSQRYFLAVRKEAFATGPKQQ